MTIKYKFTKIKSVVIKYYCIKRFILIIIYNKDSKWYLLPEQMENHGNQEGKMAVAREKREACGIHRSSSGGEQTEHNQTSGPVSFFIQMFDC